MEPTHSHPHTEHHHTEPSQKQMDPNSIPGAIIVAGLLIAVSIFISSGVSKNQQAPAVGGVVTNAAAQAPAAPGVVGAMRPVTKEDRIRGSASAQLVIVEYSDPECPFCKSFHQTMQRLMSEYGPSNKLAWVYRNFPIPALHSKAPAEAEAAECAGVVGGNDKFWQFVDELYKRTNSNNSLDPAELPKIASDIGIELTQWNTCQSSGQTKAKITADTADAASAGARGTPYSVIINTKTGKKIAIPGAEPYEMVKQSIDDALAGK